MQLITERIYALKCLHCFHAQLMRAEYQMILIIAIGLRCCLAAWHKRVQQGVCVISRASTTS